MNVVLDQTIFHPQGGGQPSDEGWITLLAAGTSSEGASTKSEETSCEGTKSAGKAEDMDTPPDEQMHHDPQKSLQTLRVTFVKEVRRFPGTFHCEVQHLCEVPLEYGEDVDGYLEGLRAAGWGGGGPGGSRQVRLEVDGEKRLLFARYHSAGHALDAAIQSLGFAWKAGKGYCFPDGAYVEFHLNVDQDEWYEKINNAVLHYWKPKAAPASATPDEGKKKTWATGPSSQDKTAAKTAAYEDLRKTLETKMGAEDFRTGKVELSFDENLTRMLAMAGEAPVPCGGTHVTRMEHLGPVSVTKCVLKKNVMRVSYSVPEDFELPLDH